MDPTVLLMFFALTLYAGALGYAIVWIARSEGLNRIERAAWIVGVVCFPIVGSLVWFIAGPHPSGLKLGRSERG